MTAARSCLVPASAVDTSPFHDKAWRLNNLYTIQDKAGRTVPFRLNEVQQAFLDERHGRDCIVKARQLGLSTLLDIDVLDDVLFHRNFNANIIAHTLPDARKLFSSKVKFPYEHLPGGLQKAFVQESDSHDALTFGGRHQSSIHVSTSARSGTIHSLHVSEMGKIAATTPAKAQEIITGSFEAVPLGGKIAVESTAEGAYGQFYDLAMAAKRKQDAGAKLSPLDFKLHTFPWWIEDQYALPDTSTVVDADLEDYFEALLKNHGVYLTPGQRAWYAAKRDTLQDRMLQEYPSTFLEAFEVAIKGAYYADSMARMRLENRIGRVSYDPNYPVFTGWDLGLDDSMSIWWAQFYGGYDLRLIDYYENRARGLEHYVQVVVSKPYIYEMHFMPHDARRGSLVSEIEGEKLDQTARRLGLRPLSVVKRTSNMHEIVTRDINIVRRFLARASIDQKKCAQGIKCLDGYQAEWDEQQATFARRPLHNWAIHGADALRYLAIGLQRRYMNVPDEDYAQLEPEPVY